MHDPRRSRDRLTVRSRSRANVLRLARVLALALACGSLACESRRTSADGTGPGEGPIHVTGRLLDAETGRPVSRARIWIHGFNDDPADPTHRGPPKQHRSLAPEDATTFEFNLVEPTIRLRVADRENVYELFEQKLSAQDGRLDVDVRLIPLHWVRLHGRVYWREGSKLEPFVPTRSRWRDATINLLRRGPLAPDDVRGGSLSPDDEGNYSTRVPRELLKVLTIDSPRGVSPRELDLRDERGEEREQDFVFEE